MLKLPQEEKLNLVFNIGDLFLINDSDCNSLMILSHEEKGNLNFISISNKQIINIKKDDFIKSLQYNVNKFIDRENLKIEILEFSDYKLLNNKIKIVR